VSLEGVVDNERTKTSPDYAPQRTQRIRGEEQSGGQEVALEPLLRKWQSRGLEAALISLDQLASAIMPARPRSGSTLPSRSSYTIQRIESEVRLRQSMLPSTAGLSVPTKEL